jgi:hypothetical protein
MLSVAIESIRPSAVNYAEGRSTECFHAECRGVTCKFCHQSNDLKKKIFWKTNISNKMQNDIKNAKIFKILKFPCHGTLTEGESSI